MWHDEFQRRRGRRAGRPLPDLALPLAIPPPRSGKDAAGPARARPPGRRLPTAGAGPARRRLADSARPAKKSRLAEVRPGLRDDAGRNRRHDEAVLLAKQWDRIWRISWLTSPSLIPGSRG